MAFDRARAVIQKERPAHLYPEVLRRCFNRLSVEFGVPIEQDERAAFAATPHQWPAYADSHTGLTVLQARAKVGALTRISHTIFARSRGLRDELIRVSGTCSLVAPEDASGAGTLSGLRVAAND
jgi:hypothetical protein